MMIWDIFFGGFKPFKLKSQLEMAVNRLQLAVNKKAAELKRSTQETAALLSLNPPREELARIRAVSVIRDEHLLEAYEILSTECWVILERIRLIDHHNGSIVPPEIRSCVSDLLCAANSPSLKHEIPELRAIRKQFRARYGKQIETEEASKKNTHRGGRLVTILSSLLLSTTTTPSSSLVEDRLTKLCRQFRVNWSPTMTTKATATTKSDTEKRPSTAASSVQVAESVGILADEIRRREHRNSSQRRHKNNDDEGSESDKSRVCIEVSHYNDEPAPNIASVCIPAPPADVSQPNNSHGDDHSGTNTNRIRDDGEPSSKGNNSMMQNQLPFPISGTNNDVSEEIPKVPPVLPPPIIPPLIIPTTNVPKLDEESNEDTGPITTTNGATVVDSYDSSSCAEQKEEHTDPVVAPVQDNKSNSEEKNELSFSGLVPILPIRIFRPNPRLEIAFDVRTKNPVYVMEKLEISSSTQKQAIPRPPFYEEPLLPKEYRSRLVHYRNSGYDRGHMAPAADFLPTTTTNNNGKEKEEEGKYYRDTFTLCNASPQIHSMNISIWSKLEHWCRTVAKQHHSNNKSGGGGGGGDVYVVTGPLWLPVVKHNNNKVLVGPRGKARTVQQLEYTTKAIGHPSSFVDVPTHFYKVIVVIADGTIRKFACFVVPNTEEEEEDNGQSSLLTTVANKKKRSSMIKDCVVRWTDLETVSGLRFFPSMTTKPGWKESADSLSEEVIASRSRSRSSSRGSSSGNTNTPVFVLVDDQHHCQSRCGNNNNKKKSLWGFASSSSSSSSVNCHSGYTLEHLCGA